MSIRSATDMDRIVGDNLRKLRFLADLSQEQLGEKLGVTFQQIQKYENGANRLSSSRIVGICIVLGCSLDDLFAGTEASNRASVDIPAWAAATQKDWDLVIAIRSIPRHDQRSALSAMVRSMSVAG